MNSNQKHCFFTAVLKAARTGNFVSMVIITGYICFGIYPCIAQAPSSIAGKAFGVGITSGTLPLATNGYYIFMPADSGNRYNVVGIYGTQDGSGTYTYSPNAAQGLLTLISDTMDQLECTVDFNTAYSGEFNVLESFFGATQQGQFEMFSASPPTSFIGKKARLTIRDGIHPYATYGVAEFEATSGSTYKITAISGEGTNTSGNYTYSRINASVAQIIINNPIYGHEITYLAFTNAFAGTYGSKNLDNYAFQIADFVIINPTVAITFPTAAPTYNNSSNSIDLSGTAIDDTGVTQVSWSNNRGSNGVASGTAPWIAYGISLQNGANVITITASDASGNTGQTAITVYYNAGDTTPPTISITSPTTGAEFTNNGTSISLGGTASDNVGVTQVTWINSRGGSNAATGTTIWSAPGIPLQPGANHITVKAYDAMNNRSQAVITVISPDTNPPTVNITYPTASLIYTNNSRSFNLSGTANDNRAVTFVVWSNDRGGSGIATGTNNWDASGIPLQSGTNVITVTASDLMGNTGQDIITVIYERLGMGLIRIISMQMGSTPRLSVDGPIGFTHVLQYADSIGTSNIWVNATNVFFTAKPTNFFDLSATSSIRRFYRVMVSGSAGMVLIPSNTFAMGDNLDGDANALPLHNVNVSAFNMDRYEITRALWDDVYSWAISHGYGFDNEDAGQAPEHPIHSVSWYDAVKWCNARSEKEGRIPAHYLDANLTQVYRTNLFDPYVNWTNGYRLPTEAEWEKAARGGQSGKRFPFGDTITHVYANYDSTNFYSYDTSATRGSHPNYQSRGTPYTSPVGAFLENGYGLCNMAGNIYEWCWDWYSAYGSTSQSDPHGPSTGSWRVVRGGSWYNHANDCRVAYRGYTSPSMKLNFIGFRTVLPTDVP